MKQHIFALSYDVITVVHMCIYSAVHSNVFVTNACYSPAVAFTVYSLVNVKSETANPKQMYSNCTYLNIITGYSDKRDDNQNSKIFLLKFATEH